MVDKREAELILSVKSEGSKETARDIQSMGKTVESLKDDFKGVTEEVETLTDTIRRDLADSLDDAAQQAKTIEVDTSTGGGGNAPAAAKFRGAATLLGGSGAGELVGVVDDLQDAFEGVQQLGGSLTGVLVPALSGGTAGLAAMAAVALPIAVIVGGVAVALGQLAQQSAAAREALANELSAREDAVNAAVEQGLTVSEAQQRIEGFNNTIKAQTILLEENDRKRDETFQADVARYTEQAGIFGGIVGDFFARFAVLLGQSRVGEYDKKIEQQQDKLDKATESQSAFNNALDEGLFKTDDAAKTETALTETRAQTSNVTSAAQKAETQYQQAAQKAEQQREQAIQKAQQEAEQRAQQAANAQKQYADAVKNATTNYKQAVQDIGTKLKQTLTDNTTSLFRDVSDIATKYRRDEYNDTIKSNRDERDALKNQLRDIEDIRADARDSELEAVRDGDFKQLFLAREAGVKELKDSERNANRERTDRAQALADQREDLLRNAQQTRSDRMLAYDRQNSDARLAQARDIQQAQLARQRALQTASEGYNAELKQLGNYLQARLKMQGDFYNKELGQGQPGKGGTASAGKVNPFAGMIAVIRK